ncbi:Fe-S oxidoreductase [Candidatus Syntrophocurvum alkaliphilum]|uniref:Fe-S oxidoreductase n=1 Tax=Candidatus Syntrophocurvum alkaliphilum TaxID=2293317 RepID=A0A6I6DEG0_9FIRM|nr:B12-binding domain-containing radical SAM protein [Candidatus Syntrophocurvum alkaliphilum]QGT99412.1 Fe-S oxidoreductase [Candidatus Syntrophocurvum alkaliphilum]
MKVLLVALNAKFIHSSLSLQYLKAYCNDLPLEIKIKEFSINEYISDIMDELYLEKPDVLCFSCYIWNINQILELCNDYKKIDTNIKIVLGGPEVSYDSHNMIENNNFIDFIVRGEGEETFKELLNQLYLNQSVTHIKGLTYSIADKIYSNTDRELVCNLDSLPSPHNIIMPDDNKVIYYETSRGCPFNCTYCLSSTTKGVRAFSLDRVKRDLDYLIEKQTKLVKFVDRTFNFNESRAKNIMEHIINRNGNTKFHFEIQAELLTKEMIDFLQNVPSDLFDFEIGIQTTFPPALEAINRKTDWDKLKENITLLKKNDNIHLHLDLIAGLPYESYEYFSSSFNMVYELEPDVLQLGFLKLLKGSEIRIKAKSFGYRFKENPPYQVLANKYITYEQILYLKRIEELLNKYFNSHIMRNSLKYITNNIYNNNAFQFYEDLADYWENYKYFNKGHKRDFYYTILKSFIKDNYIDHDDLLNDIIKFDFLINNKSYNLPDQIIRYNPSNINEKLSDYIKEEKIDPKLLATFSGKSIRTLRKYVRLEYFKYNPITYKKFNEDTSILFEYDPYKKTAFKFSIMK